MGRRNIFSNQKRGFWNNKIFYVVMAAVFVFGIFMVKGGGAPEIPDNYDTPLNEDIRTNVQISSNIDNNDETDENDVLNARREAYYLLKEAEGQIKLYHYDENGNERLLRVTDIPFNLISEADQEYFKEGVVIIEENELNEILQDFES